MDAAIVYGQDAAALRDLLPGAYLLIFGGPEEALELRRAGFSLQDSFAFFLPGPVFRSAFLFRKPPATPLMDQFAGTGVGTLNIDGCRVPGVAKVPWGKIRAYRVFDNQDLDGPACIDAPPANPLGRWPTNVGFVHAETCVRDDNVWICSKSCPARHLPSDSDVPELYPQFPNEAALVTWLGKLLAPPGRECVVRGVDRRL